MEEKEKDDSSVVGVFDAHEKAEDAIKALGRAGIPMRQLSIVGKDYHSEEQVVGYYNAGDRMAYWGKLGAFWGGLWGVLFGAAFFWVPGIGPLIVGGPLVSSIVAALEGAAMVGGLSAAQGYCGCATIEELRREARLCRVTVSIATGPNPALSRSPRSTATSW